MRKLEITFLTLCGSCRYTIIKKSCTIIYECFKCASDKVIQETVCRFCGSVYLGHLGMSAYEHEHIKNSLNIQKTCRLKSYIHGDHPDTFFTICFSIHACPAVLEKIFKQVSSGTYMYFAPTTVSVIHRTIPVVL